MKRYWPTINKAFRYIFLISKVNGCGADPPTPISFRFHFSPLVLIVFVVTNHDPFFPVPAHTMSACLGAVDRPDTRVDVLAFSGAESRVTLALDGVVYGFHGVTSFRSNIHIVI